MERVAVLMGGPSREHDVSLASGRNVARALGPRAVSVMLERDGGWSFGDHPPVPLSQGLERLRDACAAVFLALHGPFGEDGTIQAILDASRIAYTGSDAAASALAMDKYRAKLVYRGAGLPTPDFSARWRGRTDTSVLEEASNLGEQLVVKPTRDGSSFGVAMCTGLEQARAALAAIEGEALVEARVRGRELTCAVIEDELGNATALPVTELRPSEGYAFFDYAAKYTAGATEEITPAPIPDELRVVVQALAVRAHRALGCRDVSRTDFMVSEEVGPLLLETNTIPGMTETSLLPQAAEAAGIPFDALVDRFALRALARR